MSDYYPDNISECDGCIYEIDCQIRWNNNPNAKCIIMEDLKERE